MGTSYSHGNGSSPCSVTTLLLFLLQRWAWCLELERRSVMFAEWSQRSVLTKSTHYFWLSIQHAINFIAWLLWIQRVILDVIFFTPSFQYFQLRSHQPHCVTRVLTSLIYKYHLHLYENNQKTNRTTETLVKPHNLPKVYILYYIWIFT